MAIYILYSFPDRVGFEPWSETVLFLGDTLSSHSASLHPGVLMGTGERNAGVT